MTDKELRKLKRTELLEILFYLRKELDELREENESLKARLDELSRSAVPGGMSAGVTNEELLASIRSVVEDCLRGKGPPGKKARKGRGRK